MGAVDLAQCLHAMLAAQLPAGADPTVGEPTLLGGGSSKENWAVDATWTTAAGRTRHELIVRQDPDVGVVANCLQAEFDLLALLQGGAVPVAPTWFSDGSCRWFGRPTVVQGRVRGRSDRGMLTPADPLGLGLAGRRALAEQLIEVLAAVHAVPVDVVEPALGRRLDHPARAGLTHWRTELSAERAAGAGRDSRLDKAFVPLEELAPPPPDRQVLLHGDFRPANVLVDAGRISALLDWEFARLGDPLDDLGWHTCAIYHREHLIAEEWEVDDILAAWTARTGLAVDADALRFWQVFSTLRLTILAVRADRLLAQGSPMGKKVPLDRLLALLDREAQRLGVG
jgi:aminoglycoside phosphotransferase (APT) family kinase protein